MFKILLPIQKAAIYLVVLSLIFYPLSVLGMPARAYAAGAEKGAVAAAAPGRAGRSKTGGAPLRTHLPAKLPGGGKTGSGKTVEIDTLEIPLLREAKIEAQNTLLAKREELDREWLSLKRREREAQKRETENGQAKSEGRQAEKSAPASSSPRSLGTFKLTAYCPCYQCSSGWGRMTSSGRTAQPHHTIAVDPDVIREGTRIKINGEVYVAEDVGSGVRGKHIDIFYESHSDALDFGVRYAEVFSLD